MYLARDVRLIKCNLEIFFCGPEYQFAVRTRSSSVPATILSAGTFTKLCIYARANVSIFSINFPTACSYRRITYNFTLMEETSIRLQLSPTSPTDSSASSRQLGEFRNARVVV